MIVEKSISENDSDQVKDPSGNETGAMVSEQAEQVLAEIVCAVTDGRDILIPKAITAKDQPIIKRNQLRDRIRLMLISGVKDPETIEEEDILDQVAKVSTEDN